MTDRAKTGVSSTVLFFWRGLFIASLNINTLLSHIDELSVFMHNSKTDILSIKETKLDSTVHDSDIYIPGFEIVRKNRRLNGRKGGSVSICAHILTIEYVMI